MIPDAACSRSAPSTSGWNLAQAASDAAKTQRAQVHAAPFNGRGALWRLRMKSLVSALHLLTERTRGCQNSRSNIRDIGADLVLPHAEDTPAAGG